MTERRLIVMRHAKSAWPEEVASDHARPLNDRGRRDAPNVARELVQLGWQPQMILSSDAQRTRETEELMRTRWQGEVPVEFVRVLYHAGYAEIVGVVEIVPETVSTLLVLGHNPGWEELVHTLSGQRVTLKTATAALLTGSGATWSEALRDRRGWQVAAVIQPDGE
jgi:phosphohistidine phosphatase